MSGIGYDRAAELGDWVKEHHELRRVVTNLAVLDFGGPDHRMRLVSVHPGVTVDDVVAATGFELALADTVEETPPAHAGGDRGDRAPRPEGHAQPGSARADGTPAHGRLHTRFCDLVGVEYPIVQTGMGWVSGAGLTAATAAAGGLGLIASATMDFGQLRGAIAQVKAATTNPFGVNLRADAADIGDRIKLLIDEQVKVASFAQAPKEALIGQLHDGGVLVVPSIGAKRHAEKVLEWGVDAVLVQGGEGGGHTGSVPTTILLPQVVDAVQGRVPVIAAGGFFDGRGLVAALAYGADAIAMGTRFLLSADSAVPQSVKDYYLGRAVTDTVVTKQIDGVPHRMLDTELVEEVESGARQGVGAAARDCERVALPQAVGHQAPRDGEGRPGDAQVARPHLDADDDGGQRADAHQGRARRRQGGVGRAAERPGRRRDRRPANLQGTDRPHRRRGDEDPGEPGGKQCLSRGCSTASTA